MYVTKNKYIPQTRCSIFCIIGFPNTIFVIPTESVLLFFFFFKKVYLEIKSDGKFIFKIPILSLSLIKYGHISPMYPSAPFQTGLSK